MISESVLVLSEDCQEAAELIGKALEVSSPFYTKLLLNGILKVLQTATQALMASSAEQDKDQPASIARLSQIVGKVHQMAYPLKPFKTVLPTDADLMSLTRLIKLGFHIAEIEQLKNSPDYSEFLGLVVGLKGIVLRLCAHSGGEMLLECEKMVDSLSPLYRKILT